MTDKEKAKYYLEVAEQSRHRAQEAEKRIEKAIEAGADAPEHKYHKLYLDLIEVTARNWKYHEEYLAAYAKETQEKFPDPAEELKKKKSGSSEK